MQITIDIEDGRMAEQILESLEQYKNKGINVFLSKQSPTNKQNTVASEAIKKTSGQSLHEKFNSILGEYAKKRTNVSISEDKRMLQEALWEKYGQ